MSYVDVAIPLLAGIACVLCPQLLVKTEEKKPLVRKLGYVLIGVAVLYLIVKLMSTR